MELTSISVEEAKREFDAGQIVFVDTRSPEAWGKSNAIIPGAIRVPADEVHMYLADIPRDRPIVTYCT